MDCLVIAAGRGSRMREEWDGKPLVPVLGIPLIERILRALAAAGLGKIYVVVGYRKEAICDFLGEVAVRLGVSIVPIPNDEWEGENGTSVLKGRELLSGSFLLVMADHLFDPAILPPMLRLPLPEGSIALGTDHRLANPLVDLEDVTRVEVADGKIRAIGKLLEKFNGFDTGIFRCTPAIFEALERNVRENGDASLTGAVRLLAGEGRALAYDIGSRFWIDVDDPAALRLAEKALLKTLRDKANDGPVARYLNRPLSIRISRVLARFPVTPNFISLTSFFCSLLAAGLFVLGGYPALALGGLLAQVASIVDGCDGEIARLKFQSSDYGGWLDAVLDRYADALLLFGLTWHHFAAHGETWILPVGFAAILGSFMLSYTADKYDSLMKARFGGQRFRLGRDVRVFAVFLGAVFNLVAPTLVAIALVMNLETLRRVIIGRERENGDGRH